MHIDVDSRGYFLKLYFDGYDFIQNELGKLTIPEPLKIEIKKSCYIETLYDNANDFIGYCMDKITQNDYLPIHLCKKYCVGKYTVEMIHDKSNPWQNKDYVLFNSNKMKCISENVEFYVCPSFNEGGNCNGIGFRIINEEEIHNAFKWLFPCGNNIIYGQDNVNKEKTCYIVEGFRDYIALKECGYNCIGLGSAKLSHKQKEYISTLTDPILLFDNDKFGLKQAISYSKDYKVATLVQTKEKDAWDTYSKKIPLKITEIK